MTQELENDIKKANAQQKPLPNLSGTDLTRANLSGANLTRANLSDADLTRANLSGANLSGADLTDANLSGANLSGANLTGTDLTRANLSGADLSRANLSRANLFGADLSGANLSRANLSGADLSGADLTEIKNFDFAAAAVNILPDGDIIGWKKCRDNVIVKLQISAKTRRSNASGRKCRAERVKVLAVFPKNAMAISSYKDSVIYRIGKTVKCDKWDDCRWNECSGGIHFFITREEAENF